MEEIRHYILTINYKRFVSNKCAEILSGACFGFGKRYADYILYVKISGAVCKKTPKANLALGVSL